MEQQNGNGMLVLPAESIVAVDLEMTGLRVKEDRILEIGAVKIEQGRCTDSFQMLVNPRRPLDERITALTGITDEMVAYAADEAEALARFLDFAGEAVLLGHNIMFDYSFLKQCALNHGYSFERKGIDTLKIARALLPGEEKKTLDALCEKYGVYRSRNHRALEDARATGELFLMWQKEWGAEQPEIFAPRQLQCKMKKQAPATPAQKRDLNHFIIYHRIDLNVDVESLSRSEASRLIDRLTKQYGKIRRQEEAKYV